MTEQQMLADDMAFLMGRAEFRRFMWRAIQMGKIFEPTTHGSEGRHLAYDEGRRNLVLELLEDCDQGQPVAHPAGIPVLTAIQILREVAQQQPSKEPRSRYDRNAELSDDADGNDGS